MPHDMELIDGDLPSHPRLISGVELIAQRIRIRLQIHRGEWLLNRRLGLPYLRWRGEKPPRVQSIGSRVREAVRTTPGVLDIRDFRVQLIERRAIITGIIVVDGENGAEELLFEATMLGGGNLSPTILLQLSKSGTIL